MLDQGSSIGDPNEENDVIGPLRSQLQQQIQYKKQMQW